MSRKRRGRPESGGTRQAMRSAGVAPAGSKAGEKPAPIDAGGTPALGVFLHGWAGPVLIAAAAGAMALWTWGTWLDVQVDFGVERYIPWRLAEGEVLYRDISFHNGPLSQYFNSLCFRAFGASLHTLVICNLAVLAALLALLYYALRQVAGQRAATGACLVFVFLFAFANVLFVGNYNYVCPYSHEMTHGLLLSLVALVAAWPAGRWSVVNGQSSGSGEGTVGAIRWAISGLALGLTFLTKAEVFLAGAVATVTALSMTMGFSWPGWRRGLIRLLCFLLALAVGPVVAFLGLASAMPARQAWLGTLGSWVVAVEGQVVSLPFYRFLQGLDNPWQNVLAMLAMTAIYGAALVPAGILGLALRKPAPYRRLVAAGVFIGVTLSLWTLRESIPWCEMARPLPLFILLAIVAAAIGCGVLGRDPLGRRRAVCQISLLIFALVLLGKIFLNAHIFHYGFVLAMPAALLSVVAALDWIPALIDRRGGCGLVFSAAAAALLGVASTDYLINQSRCMAGKTVRVGAGGDAFWADWRGAYFDAAAQAVAAHADRGTTLAVLPEGVMLNCLTGLRNPTSHINFMPVELMVFGEDKIVDCFRRHPPDLIALVHKDTSELGYRFFGRDYGLDLAGWIAAHYHELQLIGAPPLESEEFGILLLERNEPGAAKTPSQKSNGR